jgi:hypothetical protein
VPAPYFFFAASFRASMAFCVSSSCFFSCSVCFSLSSALLRQRVKDTQLGRSALLTFFGVFLEYKRMQTVSTILHGGRMWVDVPAETNVHVEITCSKNIKYLLEAEHRLGGKAPRNADFGGTDVLPSLVVSQGQFLQQGDEFCVRFSGFLL